MEEETDKPRKPRLLEKASRPGGLEAPSPRAGLTPLPLRFLHVGVGWVGVGVRELLREASGSLVPIGFAFF